MPRPTAFDHDTVLERAMLVFWMNGYANTSVDDLVEKTKLLRGSIYNSFGDKHALYIQALQRYGQKTLQQAEAILNSPEPVNDRVRNLMMVIVDMTEAEKKRGSMVCNCIAEMVPQDLEVSDVVAVMVSDMKQVIESALTRARQAGDLAKTVKPKTLARYLSSSIQGLCITAKAGAPRDELLDIVETTLIAFG